MKRVLRFKGLSIIKTTKTGVVLPLILLCNLLVPGFQSCVNAQTYCIPSATHSCNSNSGNEAISNFTLDSINNNTTCSPINYLDYSSPTLYPNIETTLNSPGTYTYTLTAEHADYASPYSVDIWIDLNNDGSFYDAGDWVAHRLEATDCNLLCSNVQKSGTLTIPSGVTSGTKRMRVRLIFRGEDESDNDPCDTIDYGEAEDYRVIIVGNTPPSNNIAVGTISPLSYCAGSPISIPYTATGSYQTGNVFIAELSNSSGSFTSPDTIGTIVDTASGTISGTIPANAVNGSGYVIRIVASNPATTGTTNSAAITINQVVPVSVSIQASPQGSICTGTSVTFTATGSNEGANPTYQWQIDGNSTGPNSADFTTGALSNNDTVTCILTSNAACTTGSPFTSNAVIMTVSATAGAGTISVAKDTICAGDEVSLTTYGSSGNVQWQSSPTGANYSDIAGAVDTSYSATLLQTTYFRVRSSGGSCNDTSSALQLTVNSLPAPPALIAHDTAICSSDSSQICVTAGYTSYFWNTGDTTDCTYAHNAGGFWVTVTGPNGCSIISSHVNITVYPVSSVSIIVQGDTLSSFGARSYQWLRNDTLISGATSPVYIAPQSGVYSVQVTDTNNCQATSSGTPITLTGINDLSFDNKVEIFPNPASGSFNIRYTGGDNRSFHVSMFNMLGEKVEDELLNFGSNSVLKVNVSQLPADTYLVQVQSGNQVVSNRIVIQ